MRKIGQYCSAFSLWLNEKKGQESNKWISCEIYIHDEDGNLIKCDASASATGFISEKGGD